MITGALVRLTEPDPANAETLRAWVNDPRVHRWMQSGQQYVSAEAEAAFIAESLEAASAGTAHRFEIHAADDGRLVGFCGLEHASAYHRHAEIGVMIGDLAEQGKGFGGDAIRALLRFGFESLGMHSIRICAYPENERALALYRRLGFVETGRDREAWLIGGAMRDLVRLDMLEGEWRAAYGTPAP